MSAIQMVQNDTAPSLDLFITRVDQSDGSTAIVDISSATINLKIKDLTTGLQTNEGHTECIILDGIGGEARYDFLAGDLPTAGSYRCDIETTYVDGTIETQPAEFIIHARGQVS